MYVGYIICYYLEYIAECNFITRMFNRKERIVYIYFNIYSCDKLLLLLRKNWAEKPIKRDLMGYVVSEINIITVYVEDIYNEAHTIRMKNTRKNPQFTII